MKEIGVLCWLKRIGIFRPTEIQLSLTRQSFLLFVTTLSAILCVHTAQNSGNQLRRVGRLKTKNQAVENPA